MKIRQFFNPLGIMPVVLYRHKIFSYIVELSRTLPTHEIFKLHNWKDSKIEVSAKITADCNYNDINALCVEIPPPNKKKEKKNTRK